MEYIEHVSWQDKPLAYIIRAELAPERTTFLTPPEFKQQVGFVACPGGGQITRHVHRNIERHLVGTSEVLIVRKGQCEIDIYSDDQKLVATRKLRVGDIMLMISGGHGLRMIEDTLLLEIKQGPYSGVDEKERF